MSVPVVRFYFQTIILKVEFYQFCSVISYGIKIKIWSIIVTYCTIITFKKIILYVDSEMRTYLAY